MRNKKIVTKFIIIALLSLSSVFSAKAQTTDALGTYTPYSLFGVGELEKPGTSFNKGMGGIGVGVRDNRYINYANPASITERDTLSFMLDFGFDQKNFYNADSKVSSAFNTANMHNIVFTAPIYRKSALIVGISPYSNVGYKFRALETDKNLIAKYGDIEYQKYGTGSINQLFVGGAFNLFRHFSIGGEMIYYFGNLNRYSNVLFSTDPSVRDVNTGWDYKLNGISGRAGVQYFGNITKNTVLTLGATYRFAANMSGDYTRYACTTSSSQIDTVSIVTVTDYKVQVPTELSFGLSLRKKDKWMFGADYVKQDWSGSIFGDYSGSGYAPSVSTSYKVGFEYIPNRYDIRYYMKRVTYRWGAYYDQTYININGKQVNAAGVTFGMSLPIFRWYNAVTWSVDLGQRGSLADNQVRERYVQFNFNFNLHDMWFIKKRYN